MKINVTLIRPDLVIYRDVREKVAERERNGKGLSDAAAACLPACWQPFFYLAEAECGL